jgi:hypothetical protein
MEHSALWHQVELTFNTVCVMGYCGQVTDAFAGYVLKNCSVGDLLFASVFMRVT